ncbi:MAG: hypothetical protein GY880_25485 [Planctomycetaceae bacterium]|nr:hypothetical protein [Planctomycetaceae bacterium]
MPSRLKTLTPTIARQELLEVENMGEPFILNSPVRFLAGCTSGHPKADNKSL